MGPDCKAMLLRDAARILGKEGLRLCVLHDAQHFPDSVASDLDAVCIDPHRVPHALSGHGGRVVQGLEHEKDAVYYVLHRTCGRRPAFAALDVSADYRRNGRVFFTADEILRDRRPLGDIDEPPTGIQFGCYLIKKILKADLTPEHGRQLSVLYAADPTAGGGQLRRFFGERDGALVAAAAHSGDWTLVQARIRSLRHSLLWRTARRDVLGAGRYWLGEMRRRVERVARPTGLLVEFCGPDALQNAGVMERVALDLAPAFRRTMRLNRPEALPPRDALRVRTWLVRSTLVLLDRSSPQREGATARRRSMSLVPVRPDIAFVIEAPTSPGSREPRRLARSGDGSPTAVPVCAARNRLIVDGSRPLDEIVVQVEGDIIDHLARRTARRLKLVAPN